MCTRAMTRIGKMSLQSSWFSIALILHLTFTISLHLQVAVHRKQLLKVKFGLEVKIFSQWFESIIQLNLCHRAEIRHRRSVESSRVILNLNICHLPSVQCLGDYFGVLLGPQVGWIQNSWIESYISDRSLTTLTWNTVHLASENYEL